MILREGQVLGPYRVLALAGSGGTGEVWRARDDRLQRDVALKVMHGSLGDEESRRRLLAEARAVGALDHPHIVVVHDILCVEDRDVLVMEFVTGEAVSRRIPPGGMTLREALKLAVAVADAVAAAHTAGVTHRDLKPANVLVSGSGSPKVLDFGLARRRPAAGPADITMLGAPESAAGLISGTPAYMSPEQAQGKPVDHRSDVFSFGALLYELLTGRRVFERPSIPETLTAVLKDEPAIPEGWPVALAHVVKRCLRKDAERRFQNMADVRIELQDVLDACDGTTDASRGRPRRRATWALRVIGAAVTVALMMIASWWALRHRSPEQAWTVRTLTTLPGVEQQAVLSRRAADRVAFVWDGGRLQNHDIYMQQVSGETPPVRLTTDIRADISPAWSPDDQQLAFLRLYGDRTDVMVMSALGGSERRVGRVPGGFAQATGILLPLSTIDWSPDGQFIALGTSTLSLLNVLTGEVIQFSPAPAPGTDRDPAFSPDGRALVYSRGAARVYRQLWVQRIHADGRADGLPELLTPEFRVYKTARGGSITMRSSLPPGGSGARSASFGWGSTPGSDHWLLNQFPPRTRATRWRNGVSCISAGRSIRTSCASLWGSIPRWTGNPSSPRPLKIARRSTHRTERRSRSSPPEVGSRRSGEQTVMAAIKSSSAASIKASRERPVGRPTASRWSSTPVQPGRDRMCMWSEPRAAPLVVSRRAKGTSCGPRYRRMGNGSTTPQRTRYGRLQSKGERRSRSPLEEQNPGRVSTGDGFTTRRTTRSGVSLRREERRSSSSRTSRKTTGRSALRPCLR